MCLLRGVPTHTPQGYNPSSFLLWEEPGIVTAADNRFHQARNHPPVTFEVRLGARGKGLTITVLAKFAVTIPITHYPLPREVNLFFFFLRKLIAHFEIENSTRHGDAPLPALGSQRQTDLKASLDHRASSGTPGLCGETLPHNQKKKRKKFQSHT